VNASLPAFGCRYGAKHRRNRCDDLRFVRSGLTSGGPGESLVAAQDSNRNESSLSVNRETLIPVLLPVPLPVLVPIQNLTQS
jgi:hypothetical protein